LTEHDGEVALEIQSANNRSFPSIPPGGFQSAYLLRDDTYSGRPPVLVVGLTLQVRDGPGNRLTTATSAIYTVRGNDRNTIIAGADPAYNGDRNTKRLETFGRKRLLQFDTLSGAYNRLMSWVTVPAFSPQRRNEGFGADWKVSADVAVRPHYHVKKYPQFEFGPSTRETNSGSMKVYPSGLTTLVMAKGEEMLWLWPWTGAEGALCEDAIMWTRDKTMKEDPIPDIGWNQHVEQDILLCSRRFAEHYLVGWIVRADDTPTNAGAATKALDALDDIEQKRNEQKHNGRNQGESDDVLDGSDDNTD
jgi:hypothetical protein